MSAVNKAMWVERARILAFWLLALLVAVSLGMLGAKSAHAATFTVNSTGNENDLDFPGGIFDGSSDGKCFTGEVLQIGDKCTLRAAIQQANRSSGADTIAFDIPTTGVATISPTPTTVLPNITQRVTIDGYTQGDATENTETQPGKTDAVLKVELDGASAGNIASGLVIDASNVVVRGLVINSYFTAGILFAGGEGHKVEGNFIGTDPGGTVAEGNGMGVRFFSTAGSTIGGTSHEARNLISGNGSGVGLIDGSSGNMVQGNLIGTDKNGNPLGNAVGGVVITSSSSGNSILSNSIFSNTFLGIDLMEGTSHGDVTANDPKDPDTGANRRQNYPEITSAQLSLIGDTNITGTLNSTPSTRLKRRTFTIQFFSSPAADPSGFGEGKTFLGGIQVQTDRQGNASFSFPTRAVSDGEFITATATRNSTGDTSEFSRAVAVEGPVLGGGG